MLRFIHNLHWYEVETEILIAKILLFVIRG